MPDSDLAQTQQAFRTFKYFRLYRLKVYVVAEFTSATVVLKYP